MIDETEEQDDVKTDYFGGDQAGKKQTGNSMDITCEAIKPPTLMELLGAKANDLSCSQAALTIGLLKSMLTFGTEVCLVRFSPIDGESQRLFTTTLKPKIFQLCH